MRRTVNLRPSPSKYDRVGIRSDSESVTVEVEDEGSITVVSLSHEQARKLAEMLLKATLRT